MLAGPKPVRWRTGFGNSDRFVGVCDKLATLATDVWFNPYGVLSFFNLILDGSSSKTSCYK